MSWMCRTSSRSSNAIKGYLQKHYHTEIKSYLICPRRLARNFSSIRELRQSAVPEEAVQIPQSEATPSEEKIYSPKITAIVDQISELNLLEVADLNNLLKRRLNIR